MNTKEILKLLSNSSNKVTFYWSKTPGHVVHKVTGKNLSDLSWSKTVLDWYETLAVVIKDLNEEMSRLALQPLAESDLCCELYVSQDINTILKCLSGFEPNVNCKTNNVADEYFLTGTFYGRKVWMNAFHPQNLIVFVPENPRSVLGILYVKGFSNDVLESNLQKNGKKLQIKFKKMSETAKIPTAIRNGDIGFDLYCDEDFSMVPGTVRKIRTNIQLADMPMTDTYGNRIFMKIEGRSGLSTKGIFPTGGIIDPTYRGEIGVVLNMMPVLNFTDVAEVNFKKGDRIAQLVIYKVATSEEVEMGETDKITETNRGSAGFGSSGI